MSNTTSTDHDFDIQPGLLASVLTPPSLQYVVTHVFSPENHPKEDDYTPENAYSLVSAVCAVAHAYTTGTCGTSGQSLWCRITRMLDNLQATIGSNDLDHHVVVSQLREMQTGDTLTFFVRHLDLGIILTKREDCTRCEAFDTSLRKFIGQRKRQPWECTFPGSTIELPNEMFDDAHFQSEFAKFLSHPDSVGSNSYLSRLDPQDINALVKGILHNVGRADDIGCVPEPTTQVAADGHTDGLRRITKHVRDAADRVYCHWRRLPLWLLIRVAIQSMAQRSLQGILYKQFMLFFMCILARDERSQSLSIKLLDVVSSKILRRMDKFRSPTPEWLSEWALRMGKGTLDIMWGRLKAPHVRPSPFRNPSQDELSRDTRLLLPHCDEYIRDVLANPIPVSTNAPFHPSHRPRGTIKDFLSSKGEFFDEAYRVDPGVTLYDVEQSIEEGIDDWLASVTDVDEACAQLEMLMNEYMSKSRDVDKDSFDGSPVSRSIRLLTGIELYVAIDKLAVKEIPMFADYPPEVPIVLLEKLLLCGRTNLHRLSCAYEYLSARHSQSRPGWSLHSDEFTEDSFPVRYYDQSQSLQHLKARIEQDALDNANLCRKDAGSTSNSDGDHSESGGSEKLRLPDLPLHAKVVVFELQCPAIIRIWRSTTVLFLFRASLFLDLEVKRNEGNLPWDKKDLPWEEKDLLLSDVASLKPYFIEGPRLNLKVRIHLAYFHSSEIRGPSLRYVCEYPDPYTDRKQRLDLWRLVRESISESDPSFHLSYFLTRRTFMDSAANSEWIHSTSVTPNTALATQAECPSDLSLDELITLLQLRSGGLLQWLNILQGLRSRSLNLRHLNVHYLLTFPALQVGPLDVDTGTWTWHQELQDSRFCIALLDELDSLFADVGGCAIDPVLTSTISLLLSRVLASSPCELVTNRAIALLRSVRKKAFKLVQELSYDLIGAFVDEERKSHFYELAAACLSTFDVDRAILHKLFDHAEDVDALLSCAFFINVLFEKYYHSSILRNRRLPYTLEEVLKDVILSDPSDYGVDLAVARMCTRYRPGSRRWEQSPYPNSRWLACKAEPTMDYPSQTVQINLLSGELRAAGQLSDAFLGYYGIHRELFSNQGFFVAPSDLPGMDWMAIGMLSKPKVHFSLVGKELVIRAQCDNTGETLAFIPSSKLSEDLPSDLIRGHIHWLNLATKIIEIRPLSRPWEESPNNWRIDGTSGQYRAYKGHETLVDMRSPTWNMISDCFACLDTSWGFNLAITCRIGSAHESQLWVTLSHYSLSFFVNESAELESCEIKGMVYDEGQYIDVLFGLEHFLVLRPKNYIVGTLALAAHKLRCILIPSGPRLARMHEKYLAECLGFKFTSNKPSYHIYDVDTDMGCLRGNGSIINTGYLAYLHALTSCHRPDLLTGKTGVQAALSLLQSGRCHSVMKGKALGIRVKDWQAPTLYPQIYSAIENIESRYYWENIYDSARLATLSHSSSFSITLDQLLVNRSAPVEQLPPRTRLSYIKSHASSDDITTLARLSSSLQANSAFQNEYLARLDNSAHCLHTESHVTCEVVGDRLDTLQTHFVQCRTRYHDALEIVKKYLGPTSDPPEQAPERSGQWPAITADVLLRYLASTSPVKIHSSWKKCLISLSLLLLDLQRSRRLLQFALDGLEDEFAKELENEGCDGWDPEEYPDWLLIQVEGNFLIRRTQAETAKEMISPKSRANTVLQVNMGEGKSSVIIPIVAAALADGEQLVRVIVPSSLTAQMFDLLVARLGGLTNRPIYHLPFSRTLRYGKYTYLSADDLHKLVSQCMSEHGILLMQPEHAVSLRLKGVEEQICKDNSGTDLFPRIPNFIYRYISTTWLESLKLMDVGTHIGNMFRSLGQSSNHLTEDGTTQASEKHADRTINAHDSSSGARWLKLQKWLHSHVRDILDESDEILHARFQLIYTIGTQQHMDGYPDRWTTTQQVLRLFRQHMETLSVSASDGIQYEPGPRGSFPRVHIQRGFDNSRITSLITTAVMAGELPNFDFRRVPPAVKDAIRAFISDEHVLQIPETVRKVEEYARCSEQGHLWSRLLLLRGLLTSNVLFFSLAQRRWRVDYGLIPRPQDSSTQVPTMLAVPYRAKDVPAPNTQFGHPDLTIILTCLSYYYAGLSKDQLRTSFEVLLDEDDPSREYAVWIKECETVPESLQRLSDITLRSSERWDEVIFPLFCRNQAAIDFYLSRVVFPKEAKEFPLKLSGSSWDLAEKRDKLITGFSGTNDSRWLLPMSIDQCDLDHQKGSNARVLAFLLQQENGSYAMAHERDKQWNTSAFLRLVTEQTPEIRVLLDVGSQILDLSNREVAITWLEICHDAPGAVYFDENDEISILTRSGVTSPLLSSPLSQQLGRCIVYLDHAHTRGTDIKLPIGARAAVTLGPRVTKDALVQGCMRMRKLGNGHSVMFFAPPEVDRSIRGLVGKEDGATAVTTANILCWAINETWADIQRRAPFWAQQGMNHRSRYDDWSRFCKGELTRKQFSESDAWIQPGVRSLLDLYGPCEANDMQSELSSLDADIQQRCKSIGVLSFPNAQMDEEQEREVNREREREREVELPPKARPAKHHLHPDVVIFVKTGVIPPLHSGSAFVPVFTTLERSTAATRDANVWSPSILATADFCRTVDPKSTQGTMDQYLRPVQWILTRRNSRDQVLILLSPYEANCLLPDIRASEYVYLHLYAPRTSERMKPSDDLRLYSIPSLPSDWTPPWDLIDQLNVFAGQLYLRDYTSYLRLSRFLGIPTEEAPDGPAIRRNLFNIPGSLEEVAMTFSGSPLPCVMALLAIRTRGRPFAHTHMGRILQGQVLREQDFERPRSRVLYPGHDHITHDEVLPSPQDMDCDPPSWHSGSSTLPRPKKRGFEMVEVSEPEIEPPRKRRS